MPGILFSSTISRAIRSRVAGSPAVSTYLVWSALMASIAAALAFSGEGKSGSPAEKFRTSTPWALRALARFMTAMVEEGLSEVARLDRRMVGEGRRGLRLA